MTYRQNAPEQGLPAVCSECDRSVYGRGLCNMHYQRLRKTGTVEARPRRKVPLAERYWAKVEKTDTCWNWRGACNDQGYGQIHDGEGIVYAHRLAYVWEHGSIAEGLVIDHQCHNTRCVRPDHLRQVTMRQNTENKGRLQRTNTTGYRGVTQNRKSGRFIAQAKRDGRMYYGGSFLTVEEAAAAAVALRCELQTHNDLDRVA